jgi:beta-1,4-mannosyl-glycoprotein beta-1,4-N-acetylglucosaminyltransferase
MIYDCFPFFNELDLLEIRLHEHTKFADKFIITEANKTHSGIIKPFLFEQNIKRYKQFKDKIIYLKLIYDDNNLPPTNLRQGHDLTCRRDDLQKDFPRHYLHSINLKDDDIIVNSDLDEIVDAQKIEQIIKLLDNHSIIKCLQKTLVYKFNILLQDYDVTGFDGPKISKWNYMKRYNWTDLRLHLGEEQYPVKCGWHFTYIGENARSVLIKLKSYSHWNDFANVKTEEDAINALVEMLNINFKKSTVTIDETFPCYLRNNIDKFRKFIL